MINLINYLDLMKEQQQTVNNKIMSSPFQSAFMAKSPVKSHGDRDLKKAKKLSEKGGQGQGGYDYENDKVMALKASGEKKNASHTDGGDEESNVDRNEIPDASALKNNKSS